MKLDSKSRASTQLDSVDEASLDDVPEHFSVQQRDYLVTNLCPAVKECMTAAVAVRLSYCSLRMFSIAVASDFQ
jgi:hypothetical protein